MGFNNVRPSREKMKIYLDLYTFFNYLYLCIREILEDD